MTSSEQIKMVVVNQHKQQQTKQAHILIDPLIQQLNQLKITQNLLKQVNFNSTVNKFEYLQQLLKQQYKKFQQKVTQVQLKQKQEIIKNVSKLINYIIFQMKRLNKQVHKLGIQTLRYKQSQFPNFLINNPQQVNELEQKIGIVIETKKDSMKYLKLSEGMLNAVEKIQGELDNFVKKKFQASKTNSNSSNISISEPK